jgi:hypothetical protein
MSSTHFSQLVWWLSFYVHTFITSHPMTAIGKNLWSHNGSIFRGSVTLLNVSLFLLLFLLTLLTYDLSSCSVESCHEWPQAAGDQTQGNVRGSNSAQLWSSWNQGTANLAEQAVKEKQVALKLSCRTDQGSAIWSQPQSKMLQSRVWFSGHTYTSSIHCLCIQRQAIPKNPKLYKPTNKESGMREARGTRTSRFCWYLRVGIVHQQRPTFLGTTQWVAKVELINHSHFSTSLPLAEWVSAFLMWSQKAVS